MPRAPETRAPLPAYRYVLVPLDGSELAAGALGTARAIAERFGADLHTVSAAQSVAEEQELRVHAADRLGRSPDDPCVHVDVAEDPASLIVQRADELGACLVCMSTHGRGRIAGAVMGSVARRVLEARDQPTVAVGPFADRPSAFGSTQTMPFSTNQMVACVDGGEASEHVLPVAAAWASSLGLALTIVTVAEPSPPPVRPGATWHRQHGPDADAGVYVDQLAERWRAQVPGLRTRAVYDPISAAEGIKTYLDAHPSDLVAVTTHARSGLQRLMLGAGAASIVHASTAPVLVVPLLE